MTKPLPSSFVRADRRQRSQGAAVIPPTLAAASPLKPIGASLVKVIARIPVPADLVKQ